MTSTVERAAAGRTIWNIDAAHSLVEFSAKHMMITTVKGRFAALTGAITADEHYPGRSAASVSIDAGSIDTREPQRDTHLRSADFLDAERFPTISFESRKVDGAYSQPGDRFRVLGDLTIRGTTRPMILDATFEGRGRDPWGGERVSFSAETTIDRRDYGLTWNQTLALGGLLVGNEIRILLEVQAVKAT
ncbi:MAG TPA: YceI family protein [Gemmatimonadales bacterium]|nr:YceI family protein [Gemmatimonadales bacterium]